MKKQQQLVVRKRNVYVGGTYCVSIDEQARILESIAKKHNSTDCVKDYTDGPDLNYYLRGLQELRPPYQEEVERMLECMILLFDKVPLYRPPSDVVLYRGIGVEFEEAANDCGFMSTSTKIDIAARFSSEGKIMVIHLLPGECYKILPVERITVTPGEYEVILAPGRGTLEVRPMSTDEQCISGYTCRHYDYIPNPDFCRTTQERTTLKSLVSSLKSNRIHPQP